MVYIGSLLGMDSSRRKEMIWLIFVLNFAISWFNAWAVGKSWALTKSKNPMGHLVNWCGLIMSASGFTWCYLIVLAFVGTALPETLLMSEEAAEALVASGAEVGPLVNQEMLEAFFNAGYILIWFPIVGSGLIITVDAWAHFYRRRTFASGGVAAYDTFAMVYNISSGIRHIPGAFDGVMDFFTKGSGDNKGKMLLIAMLVMAVLAGVLTTYFIFNSSKNAHGRAMAWKVDDLKPRESVRSRQRSHLR